MRRGLGRLGDLVGPDAARADPQPADAAVDESSHPLQVRFEPAGADIVGVADDPADDRDLAADFAVLGHDECLCSLSGPSGPTGTCKYSPNSVNEDPDYLSKQLITYLGNKRALLPEIGQALDHVVNRLGRRKLRILDAFSGSGVVSRLFKGRAACLLSNDLEAYAAIVARCFLTNRRDVDVRQITQAIAHLNDRVDAALLQDGPRGFIEELYAPRDDEAIQKGERVFYSNRNARRLDLYCRYLEDVPADVRPLCLGPLLSEASIHANTSGVFKGFHKDRSTGLGRFGGTNADALSRILGEIRLMPPVLSRFSCDVAVSQEDAQMAVQTAGDLDLAYFDPPYNQHPYGSNYLSLIHI